MSAFISPETDSATMQLFVKSNFNMTAAYNDLRQRFRSESSLLYNLVKHVCANMREDGDDRRKDFTEVVSNMIATIDEWVANPQGFYGKSREFEGTVLYALKRVDDTAFLETEPLGEYIQSVLRNMRSIADVMVELQKAGVPINPEPVD